MVIETALFAAALVEVGKKLAEKAVIEPALKTGLEPFQKWLTSGYDKKKAAEELRATTQDALDDFKAEVGDKFERLKIVNSLTALNADAHQLLAASAVEMTSPEPGHIPAELLAALHMEETDRPWLARYLTYLRKHIEKAATFQPLITFANDMARNHRLDGIATEIARLVSDTSRMKSLLELLTAERGLTGSDPAVLEAYLKDLRTSLGTLSLPFVRKGPASTSTAKLTNVFVPLYVRDEKAEEQARKKAEKRSPRPQDMDKIEDVRPVDFNNLLARYERFVLIGLPGSGKTTLLRRAGLAFAEGRAEQDLGWKGAPLLPIFVRLRNFGSFLAKNSAEFCEPSSGALVAYLERMQKTGKRHSLTPDFFDSRLSEGKCLVLLDGLDEVAGNRVEVAHFVQKFIEEYGRNGNRVGISSRPRGYDEDVRARLKEADLALAEVTPLQPAGIRQLIQNLLWMDDEGREKYKNDTHLVERVLGNPRLTEIAGVPLFCSALVQVYKYHGIDLPQRRVDVLAEIADLLLGFWHAQKDVAESHEMAKEDGTEQHYDGTQESVEYKRNRLAHLAYGMQTELKSVEISETQAQKSLAAYLQEIEGASPMDAKRWAKGFLRNSHDRSGILVEISPGTYSFIHKNFMEYFAATALIQTLDDPVDAALAVLDEDPTWWDEMLCFAAAHPSGSVLYKKWTPALLADASRFERGSEAWARRLTIAGMMARDMTNRLPHAQRVEVQNSLYQAATDTGLPAPTRAHFADLLDDVGLSRELDKDICTFIPIEQNGILFYLARYPVTNAQYARFLKPENFANKDLWVDFPKYAEPEKKYAKIGNWGDEGWQWLKQALSDAAFQEKQDIEVENGVVLPRYWKDARFGALRPNAPVVGISWYEANAYCKWLAANWRSSLEAEQNSEFKNLNSELKFRLPTEAEWILAAGGEQNNRFAFGELKDLAREITQHANTSESDIGRTTPVWMYPQGSSDPYKLMDMSGNVWEWQANFYNKDHNTLRLRGGSWLGNVVFARVSLRGSNRPYGRGNGFGFRVLGLFSPPN